MYNVNVVLRTRVVAYYLLRRVLLVLYYYYSRYYYYRRYRRGIYVCTALWQKQNYFHFFSRGLFENQLHDAVAAESAADCPWTAVLRRDRCNPSVAFGTFRGDRRRVWHFRRTGLSVRRAGEFGRVERFAKYPVEKELKPGRKRTEKKIGKKLWGRFSLRPCEIRYWKRLHNASVEPVGKVYRVLARNHTSRVKPACDYSFSSHRLRTPFLNGPVFPLSLSFYYFYWL